MALPFAHLQGRAMWARCDHDGTCIDGEPARVRLAAASAEDGDAPLSEDQRKLWEGRRGAAAVVSCGPEACEEWQVVLLDPEAGLLVLDGSEWQPLPIEGHGEPAEPSDPLRFRPQAQTRPEHPAGLALDPWNGLWLLDRKGQALFRMDSKGRLAARVALPAGCVPVSFGCTADGLVLVGGIGQQPPHLLFKPWQGEWRGLNLELAEGTEPLALAADPEIAWAALLLRHGRGHHLVVSNGRRWHRWPLPMLRQPMHLLITGEDSLLVSEPCWAPGDPRPTHFRRLVLRSDGPDAEEGYGVRGFDGRALWRQGGHWYASSAFGARQLVRREPALRGQGRVETWALDSGTFACQWHRLFLDACVPPGTAVRVEVRSSDDLPPWEVRRGARPPLDRVARSAAEPPPPPLDDPWPPLGSLAPDDQQGWQPLGLADRRRALADQPLPTRGIERPSGDRLARWRRPDPPSPAAMETLEWLITAPPGRFLWLRLHLEGNLHRSPVLFALRVSHPRPSLLEHLPAFWREDPEGSDLTERVLALFEAELTDQEQRAEALVRLFLPALAPADALPWLAGFLALRDDDRLPERVRRQLLHDMASLYRKRGTLPGLQKLLSIIAEAPVQIVEGFRLRHVDAAFLGEASVGPALELGGSEGPLGLESAEDWEQQLALAHGALLEHRAGMSTPCPEQAPADPLAGDPLQRFYRRHAHRFTVLVPRFRSADRAEVLEQAIEAAKPAHTLHRLCWIEAGFCLGQSSRVGLHHLGRPARAAPPVLGRALLGGGTAPLPGGEANLCRSGVAVLPFLPSRPRQP